MNIAKGCGNNRILSATFIALIATSLIPQLIGTPAHAQEPEPKYSYPIRWCVIGDDANDNGVFDPGEDGGAPAFTDPANVGEPDTDNTLWRRHERISENTYIPQAGITLRSSLYNIVEDSTLRFPIIPDPDTSDPDHQYGDVLSPEIDSEEWNTVFNACVGAWRDEHSVEDLGIVAVVARKVVNEDGTENAYAFGWYNGLRRVLLEDNAWSLPASSINTSPVDDGVDKTLGHEFGHTLPTPATEGGYVGLRHVCSTGNGGQDDDIMRGGRWDLDGNGWLDNFRLSDNVVQTVDDGSDDGSCTSDDVVETVDQISLIREASGDVPGCKIIADGPDPDCSIQSDVRVDSVNEFEQGILDISMLFARESDEGTTSFIHELFDIFTNQDFNNFSSLEYYVLADLDNNNQTGGSPEIIGVPTIFQGAEIVTRVQVFPFAVPDQPEPGVPDRVKYIPIGVPPNQGAIVTSSPTFWRFQNNTFIEVTDDSIRSQVIEAQAAGHLDDEIIEARTSDSVAIEFSSNLVGSIADSSLRVQAIAVGTPVNNTQPIVVDLLPNSEGEEGTEFRLRDPTFPECEVNNPVAAGETASASISGLLPDSNIHVVFGDKLVGEGSTDEDGSAVVEFPIPNEAGIGDHLVTVGVDNTALTADCFANVTSQPEQVSYSVKFVCVPEVGQADGAVIPQNYSTVVNVHNPHSSNVTFVKKAVIAQSEDEERGNISRFVRDRLAPDQALSIDCNDIVGLFNNATSSVGDGFVVLKSDVPLDVSAVYTTENSIDIEYIEPTKAQANDTGLLLPDLTINLTSQTRVTCPTGQGSCVHVVPLEIRNLSDIPVPTPFQVDIQTSNGLSTTVIVPPPIGGSAVETLIASLGPGSNCYNPDCEVRAVVDSLNVIEESDETNNLAVRLDQG